MRGLFRNGQRAAVFIHLDYTERARIVHIISEHRRAAAVFCGLTEAGAQSLAVENVVAQNEADAVVSDKALADQEGVRNTCLLYTSADSRAQNRRYRQSRGRSICAAHRNTGT